MLIQFSVENFRSFRDQVTWDFQKKGRGEMSDHFFRVDDRWQLLKTTVVYGPNASGKSNLLLAFRAFEFMVLHSAGNGPDDKLEPYEPFRLNPQKVGAPSRMSIVFLIEGIRYQYEMIFNDHQILREQLDYFPHGVKALLFSRQSGEPIKFGDSYEGGRKTIEQLLLPNQLFLSKAAENNARSVLPVYLFFRNRIMVFPFLDMFREQSLSRLYARRLAESPDSAFSKRFNALICAMDTGVRKVEVEEIDWSRRSLPDVFSDKQKKQFQEEFKYDIKTLHPVFQDGKEIGETHFDIKDESRGTQSLFVMAGILLDALEEGRVLVVDEFEKNLHPEITTYLVNLFHQPRLNPHNAQLIFATHDITQLSDQQFRRDQVWFVEKNETGASELFRLSDIKGIRSNTPIDKWYASGRLGATPLIHDVDFQIAMEE
jgi:hypothetical protein